MPKVSNTRQDTASTMSLPAHTLEPVIALRLVPRGQLYPLDKFKRHGKPAKQIAIGRAAHCNVLVDDPYVSGTHCLLWREQRRVYVQSLESKNPLLVNGAVVHAGTIELVSGSVLHVGCSALIACSEVASSQDVHIVAPNLDQFIKNAVTFYGSKPKAASKLGVAVSTFYDWIAGDRFAKKQEH